MKLANRIALFLMIVGLFSVGLFVLSDMAEAPNFWLFAGGAVCLGLGILLNLLNPRPAPPASGRFRILKPGPPREKKPKKKGLFFRSKTAEPKKKS